MSKFSKIINIFSLVLTIIFLNDVSKASEIDKCDVLAASEEDPDRKAEPIYLYDINVELALSTCQDSKQSTKGNDQLRFSYNLGRVFLADNNVTEAFKEFVWSAKKEYPPSMLMVAELLVDNLQETNKEKFIKKAASYLKKASNLGNYYAAASLAEILYYHEGVLVDTSMQQQQEYALHLAIATSERGIAYGAVIASSIYLDLDKCADAAIVLNNTAFEKNIYVNDMKASIVSRSKCDYFLREKMLNELELYLKAENQDKRNKMHAAYLLAVSNDALEYKDKALEYAELLVSISPQPEFLDLKGLIENDNFGGADTRPEIVKAYQTQVKVLNTILKQRLY